MPFRFRPMGVAVALVALGCNHAEPFGVGHYPPGGPFSTANPRQLTWNPAMDRWPSWAPDESELFYSYESIAGGSRAYCLAALPPDGGSRTLDFCLSPPGHQDSVDALELPTANSRRLAYQRATSGIDQIAPYHQFLLLAPLSNPRSTTTLQEFPYFGPNGPVELALDVVWVDSTQLIYVAGTDLYLARCLECPPDTVEVGLNLVSLDLRSSPPGRSDLTGTEGANSLALSPDSLAVYYTLMGDTRVYRRELFGGLTTLAHDFGGLGIARDVQVAGNLLVAVVGGRVSYLIDPLAGPLQRDDGGFLYAVDLRTGVESNISFGRYLFRHPALSPSGIRLAAEARQVAFDPVTFDTTVAPTADLWLLEQP